MRVLHDHGYMRLGDGRIRCHGCTGIRNCLLYRILHALQLLREGTRPVAGTTPYALLGIKFCSAQCINR